jgi:GH24 family phage-related lysozyme (muramidase)
LAAALIESLEGDKLTAYLDSGGVATIGLGHTRGVTMGMTCTPEQAAQWFAEDAAPLFGEVAGVSSVLEASALVSFGYNCGLGALKRVLAGADTIDNPVHTTDRHGNVQAGLVNRRRLESLLATLGQQMAVTPLNPTT